MKSRGVQVAVVAGAIVALCPTMSANAAPGPAPAPATILGSIENGPGSFSVYRTVDSGQRPAEAD
ncbi:hypothetical protein ASG84_26735, partial [Rhodococcus sp. Leaf278]|uniref:hypothetical protein n=1 Tax=Rhodococcus sp. Leaf278 TaxID=1736319 RepID=UPI000713CB38